MKLEGKNRKIVFGICMFGIIILFPLYGSISSRDGFIKGYYHSASEVIQLDYVFGYYTSHTDNIVDQLSCWPDDVSYVLTFEENCEPKNLFVGEDVLTINESLEHPIYEYYPCTYNKVIIIHNFAPCITEYREHVGGVE